MSAQTNSLYRAEDFPVLQNRMYETEAAALTSPRGQIHLVEDLSTGLIYNAAFDPTLMDYDAAYQNEQGLSPAFRAHLEAAAGLVERHMGLDSLIEVGCGKGTFLGILAERGAKIRGFDPTFEGEDPRIDKSFFGRDTDLHADGLVLRHVLEHIPDPYKFLCDLRDANAGGGKIYIEVPCFDWICTHKAWFDIFYEHVNYFRLSDFRRMFGEIIAADHCFGGQYLYVIAELRSLKRPSYDPATPARFPPDFLSAVNFADTRDQDVVWGGASKGLIYALLRSRADRPVAGVIDVNAAKQGRYLAAVGLKVSAPDDLLPTLADGTRIVVMNPNYLDEVRAMAGDRFDYSCMGA